MLVITTPWQEFRSLTLADLKQPAKDGFILDCWRLFPRGSFAEVTHLHLGFAEAGVAIPANL